MSASQDPNDNPVAINVVPMVDVIFCLCVFFMCSMKFAALDGLIDSWLPKDKGQSPGLTAVPVEIRVALKWDEASARTQRWLGQRRLDSGRELQDQLAAARDDAQRIGQDPPVIVDAAARVPWHEVVTVINLAKRERLHRIEFAAGPEYR